MTFASREPHFIQVIWNGTPKTSIDNLIDNLYLQWNIHFSGIPNSFLIALDEGKM